MLKNKKRLLIALGIIGIIFSGLIIAYATGNIVLDSNIVFYDNTTSHLTSSNVSDAIDELYTMTQNLDADFILEGRYVYRWSTSSWTNGTTNISSLTAGTDYFIYPADVAAVNARASKYHLLHNIKSNVVEDSYIKLIITSSMVSSAPAMSKGTYILKGNDPDFYPANKSILQNAFGSSNCTDNTTSYTCTVSGVLTATASDHGGISVGDSTGNCSVTQQGVSSCIADIAAPVSFATDSWETIITAVHSGNTSAYNVGDTRAISLDSGLGNHTLRVSNKTDCTMPSMAACGFVVEFADIISKHVMNTNDINTGGWPASEMYTYVNTTIYNALPADLRQGIATTTIVSGVVDNVVTSYDKLYLLAYTDLFGDDYSMDPANTNYTRQLDYYNSIGVTLSSASGAVKYYSVDNNTATYWLRTAFTGTFATGFLTVSDVLVTAGYDNASLYRGVSPAFRIA